MCMNMYKIMQLHFTARTTWKIRKFTGDLTYKVLLYIKLLEIFHNKEISKVSFFRKLNSLIGRTWNDSFFYIGESYYTTNS